MKGTADWVTRDVNVVFVCSSRAEFTYFVELKKCGAPLLIATGGLLLVMPVTPVNLLLESGSVGQRVRVVLNSRFYCSVSSEIDDEINSGGLTIGSKTQSDTTP